MASPNSSSGPSELSSDLEGLHSIEPQQYAYITLLTRESYVPGVVALCKSLSLVAARYPLVVFYTADTITKKTINRLSSLGCTMKSAQRFLIPESIASTTKYKLPMYAECWTKLHMWGLDTDYDRLCYLDADMLVLRNIDHVFEDCDRSFVAVGDCSYGRITEEERKSCSYFHSSCQEKPHYFNAGFFVFTPCSLELLRFRQLLEQRMDCIGGYAEQDFLNFVYKQTWKALPPVYNLQKGIKFHHPELWLPEKAYILHYTDDKPWTGVSNEYAEIDELWWSIYNS